MPSEWTEMEPACASMIERAIGNPTPVPSVRRRTDGLGYEVFNASNDDMSVGITSDDVYERFDAGVPRRCEMGRDTTLYANDKAKRLVGFAPRHSWRDVLGDR